MESEQHISGMDESRSFRLNGSFNNGCSDGIPFIDDQAAGDGEESENENGEIEKDREVHMNKKIHVNEEDESELAQIRWKCEFLEKKIKTESRQYRSMEEENKKLKTDLSEALSMKRKLLKDSEMTMAKLESHKKQVTSLHGEVDTFKSRLQSQAALIEKKEESVIELQKNFKSQEAELQTIILELESKTELCGSLSNKIHNVEGEIRSLEGVTEDFKMKFQNQETIVKEKEESVDMLQTRIQLQEAELKASATELTEKSEHCVSLTNKLENVEADLVAKVSEWAKDEGIYKERIQKAKEDVEMLSMELTRKERLVDDEKRKCEEFNSNLKSCKEEMNQTQSDLNQTRQREVLLQGELQSLKKAKDLELNEMKKTENNLRQEAQLKERLLRTECQKTLNITTQLSNSEQNIKRKELELKEVQNNCRAFEEKLGAGTQKLAVLDGENQRLKRDVEQVLQQKDRLQQDGETAKANTQAQRTQIEGLNRDMTELKTRFKLQEDSVREKENVVASLKEKVDSLERENSGFMANIKAKEEHHATLQAKVNSQEQTICSYKDKMAELEESSNKSLHNGDVEIQRMKAMVLEKEGILETEMKCKDTMNAENRALKENVSQLKNELKKTMENQEHSQGQIKLLQESLDTKTKEWTDAEAKLRQDLQTKEKALQSVTHENASLQKSFGEFEKSEQFKVTDKDRELKESVLKYKVLEKKLKDEGGQLSSLSTENSELKKSLGKSEEQMSRLKAELEQIASKLQTEKQQVEEFQKDREQLTQELQTNDEAMKKKDEEMYIIGRQIKSLETTVTCIASELKEREDYERSLQKRLQAYQDAESSKAEDSSMDDVSLSSSDAVPEPKKVKTESIKKEKSLTTEVAKAKALDKEMKELKVSFSHMQKILTESKDRENQLEGQVKESKVMIEAKNTEFKRTEAKLKAELQDKDWLLKTERQKISTIQAENNKLKNIEQSMREKNNELDKSLRKCKDLEDKLSVDNKLLIDFDAENKALREGVEEAAHQREKLREKWEVADASSQGQKKQLATVQKEVDGNKKQIQKQKDLLKEKDKQAGTLHHQLKSLETTLDCITAEMKEMERYEHSLQHKVKGLEKAFENRDKPVFTHM